MHIGVPKEIKNHEYRVALTPAGVHTLTSLGHRVQVQHHAGHRIGFTDELYEAAGAQIVASAEAVYDNALVIKVKEPQASELALLTEGQLLFTYLHLAPDPEQTKALVRSKAIAIAYETVTDAQGRLPLLIPMSEIAGRLAIQAGAFSLQMAQGGSGVLLGGVAGVSPGKVVIIGAGVVGTQAAKMAMGLGADVTILDIHLDRLRYLDDVYGPLLKTRYADSQSILELSKDCDLLIGAVLLPGKKAPKLISKQIIQQMKRGSVFVDVAIDQGGCSETSHATTHQAPTYIVDGVIHYCVANMPGAVAKTSTLALTNATLPFAVELANKGFDALSENLGLRNGLNIYKGQVCNKAVADDLAYPYVPFENLRL